jgi:hypothetical protein
MRKPESVKKRLTPMWPGGHVEEPCLGPEGKEVGGEDEEDADAAPSVEDEETSFVLRGLAVGVRRAPARHAGGIEAHSRTTTLRQRSVRHAF